MVELLVPPCFVEFIYPCSLPFFVLFLPLLLFFWPLVTLLLVCLLFLLLIALPSAPLLLFLPVDFPYPFNYLLLSFSFGFPLMFFPVAFRCLVYPYFSLSFVPLFSVIFSFLVRCCAFLRDLHAFDSPFFVIFLLPLYSLSV